MSDRTPHPRRPDEKPFGKRPAGPFILVAALLLMLLVVFGSGHRTTAISQDEFWYRLYVGEVEAPVVARDRVTGRLSGAAHEEKGRAADFVVHLADALTKQDLIQELNAKTPGDSLAIGAFLQSMRDGEVLPLRAYPLKFTEQLDPERPDSGQRTINRLFVDYADARGTHYAEIVGREISQVDLLQLIPALRTNGAEIVTGLEFDAASPLVTDEQSSFWLAFVSTFGPIVLLVLLFWFLFMRQMRGQGQGLMSFGRSRAVMYNKEKQTNVTFADVAGIDEAKEDVREIIEFLKNPDKFKRLGGRIPRGVLLVGPPGAGKTLLAKAIAGEAEVPFLSISGSDFVEMFVGVGASRVRDLFKQARDSAPCIVFLDEIDAVGRKRGTGVGGGGHDEREQTLNAILVEMDGFGTDEGIILMAATNRPDVLDPALLRPGRFDREVVIDLPDIKGREEILKVHVGGVRMAKGVDISAVARGTPGFSGAELAALVNEAAIMAAMRGHDSVLQEDFDEARDKVAFGREKKSRVMDHEDRRITAFHEAGHAVVSCQLEHTEPVHKVTIIPRGMALGATMMLPERDRMHMSRKRLYDELAVLYGGRVAEEMFCDDITSGAANDIQRATHIAKLMVTEWGMSEKLGAIHLADRIGSEFLGTELSVGKDHSEATVREIDQEMARLLTQAHGRARATIEGKREAVERVAAALLRFETIQGEEVRRLVEGTLLEDLRPAAPRTAAPAVDPAFASAPSPRTVKPLRPPAGDEGLSPA